MKIVEFPEVNVRYAENQPEYQTLPAFRHPEDPEGRVISCWQLEPEDLKKVNQTGKLWLHVLTFNQPLQPLLLDVNNPFVQDEDKTPEKDPEKHHFMSVYNYSTKNRAHAEFQAFVNKYNNYVVSNTRLAEIIDEFKSEILRIKEKYPRCDMIKLETWSHTPGSLAIDVSGNFRISVSEVKRFESKSLRWE